MDDKLNAILSGSVDDATIKLSDLTREELSALHDGEAKGKKRTRMLAAIDAEMKARDGSTGGTGDQQSDNQGDPANTPIYSQAHLDKVEQGHRETVASMFSQEQVDQMLAQQKASQDADRDRLLAEAKGGTAQTVFGDANGDALRLDPKAPSPATYALTQATQVRFVDDHDRVIETIPAFPFEPSDYQPTGDSVTLMREVDFPKELPLADVSGAFLLDDEDDPIGKATLVMPFSIGGGRTAKLAKSSLQFAA